MRLKTIFLSVVFLVLLIVSIIFNNENKEIEVFYQNEITEYKLQIDVLVEKIMKLNKNIKNLEEKLIESEKQIEEQKDARVKRSRMAKTINKSVSRGNTEMKSYMDYRKITSKSSPQYKLQQRDDVYTDEEGFRRIGEGYIVAVGTYYADNIGDLLEIELESGTVFQAIVGDFKANRHTTSDNKQHTVDGSVVEFIIDIKQLNNECKRSGDISSLRAPNMSGNIKSIKLIKE